MPIRTFVDADVLIAAARGNDDLSPAAMAILDDPDREFVGSDLLGLELLPKALYHQKTDEAAFYREFLAAAVEIVPASASLVADAHAQAAAAGLAAMDALHVAAARQAGAIELVTAERPGKPMFRVTDPAVRTIRPCMPD